MKNNLVFIIFSFIALLSHAQTDTIFNRGDRYHYTCWYDTCSVSGDAHDNGFLTMPWKDNQGMSRTHTTIKREYTHDTIAVKGLAAFVLRSPSDFPELNLRPQCGTFDTTWVPEYLIIYRSDDSAVLAIDSARYDTASPKLVQLTETRIPRGADTTASRYCHSYEAFFKSPIFVDSFFYIGGTSNCNVKSSNSETFNMQIHYPLLFIYAFYSSSTFSDNEPHSETPFYTLATGASTPTFFGDNKWGCFFPIVDYYDLVAVPNDSLMGSVAGGGRYSDLTYHTVTAVPAPGHYFRRWSDGVTANPRRVYVTSDTLLVAEFDSRWDCHVEVSSNDPVRGVVTGEGTYLSGDTATITATAMPLFRFLKWHDGSTANPRQLVLSQDTAFTALFSYQQAAVGVDTPDPISFTLSPNPARDQVVLTCQSCASKAEVSNALGRNVASATVRDGRAIISTADLPSGVYFVTLTLNDGRSGTQRLVVE